MSGATLRPQTRPGQARRFLRRRRRPASIEDLKARITARRFFWLDIAGVEPSRAGPYLEALGPGRE